MIIFCSFVIGYLAAYTLVKKPYEGWNALPPSPAHFVDLTTIVDQKLFAHTADGTSFSCLTWDTSTCWVQESVPSTPQDSYSQTIAVPDTCKWLNRFRLTHLGRTVRQCLSYQMRAPDGGAKGVYIVDQTGQVWQRGTLYGGKDDEAIIFFTSFFGLVFCTVYFVTVLVVYVINRVRKRTAAGVPQS